MAASTYSWPATDWIYRAMTTYRRGKLSRRHLETRTSAIGRGRRRKDRTDDTLYLCLWRRGCLLLSDAVTIHTLNRNCTVSQCMTTSTGICKTLWESQHIVKRATCIGVMSVNLIGKFIRWSYGVDVRSLTLTASKNEACSEYIPRVRYPRSQDICGLPLSKLLHAGKTLARAFSRPYRDIHMLAKHQWWIRIQPRQNDGSIDVSHHLHLLTSSWTNFCCKMMSIVEFGCPSCRREVCHKLGVARRATSSSQYHDIRPRSHDGIRVMQWRWWYKVGDRSGRQLLAD